MKKEFLFVVFAMTGCVFESESRNEAPHNLAGAAGQAGAPSGNAGAPAGGGAAGSGPATDAGTQDSQPTADSGSGGQGGSVPSFSCVPGQAIACPCPGAPSGVQVCNEAGNGFGYCTCSPASPDAGTQNTGGSPSDGGTPSGGGTTSGGGTPSAGGTAATGGTGGSTTASTCVPGKQDWCACIGGMLGTQKCADDGKKYLPCDCIFQNTGGTGGMSATGGSGGTSGSGGSTGSTGGVGGTGGTGGTSAGGSTSTGGSGGSSTVKTVEVTFYAPQDMPSFAFTHMSTNQLFFFPGQTCAGSGKSRWCTIQIDRSIRWEFWASTGLLGPLSWTPGYNGKCYAELGVTVKEGGSSVPFRMEPANVGCHFVLDPIGTSVSNGDKDGDGVLDGSDCASENPSIGAGLIDICGDGLDEDCSGSDLSCGSGGTGGTGGTSSTGGSGGSGGSTTVKTVTFQVFGGSYWSSPLTFMKFTDTFSQFSCVSAQRTDPQDGQLKGAVECVVQADLSKDLEFQVLVGTQWLTGYSTPGNCQKFLRAYAFVDGFAHADYDDSSSTNPPYHMWHAYLSSGTCHVFLPKKA